MDVTGDPDADLAEALEIRDELLMACRELLLGVGTREAAGLVAHIDALLDLDDEASPGAQRWSSTRPACRCCRTRGRRSRSRSAKPARADRACRGGRGRTC